MKKIFTLFVALLVGFALHAQQTPHWQMMGTPFTTSDINGNTVSLADTLAAGKAVVIQYEAAWNTWGWAVHTNGVMEAIHNTLGSQVCVLLAFVDPTTTNADIYGTGNNTQGDWTSGGTVPFPIINDANCADIIGGVAAYPTIIFISPSGYWCELYGTDWGFGPYDASAAVTSVSNVLLSVPQANHAPIVELSGQANVMLNTSVPLTANVVSIDPVTSYAWDVDGGTVVANVNEDIVVQWSSAGIKTVTCAVTNLGSDGISRTTSGTLIVNVRELWNWGDTMSYCGNGDYSSAIGLGSTGEITWGVRIPAQYMAGRNYLSSAMAYISNPGDYELLVYNPAPDSLPSTPIYQQTYNVGISNDWYSFPLFSMVQIDTTNDLWIVLHCNGVSYPASYCTYVGDNNSSLILYNGSWTPIQSLSSDLDPTWMIKAVTSATPTTPQLTVSISGPTSVMVGDVVNFTAIGYDQATYSWTFQNGTPATATGQSASTTWNAGGTYLVTVTATLGTQTVSASLTVNVADCPVNQLPYTMGFEADEDIQCLSFVDADTDGYGWLFSSAVTSSAVAYNGSECIMSASYINNVGAINPDNWMILPAVAIPSGGATMTWYDKAFDNNYYEDYYEVLLSINGTSTSDFTTLLWYGTPSSDGNWTQRTVTIPAAYAHQNINIAFRHYNCTDYYWVLIDDISITAGGATPGDTTVTWNWGDTISYCGDDVYESGIGIGANGEITWGIKIPSQYMTGRNYLSSAMAYISNPGYYELLIYNPQSGAYPSTPIYQQTYNVTASSDWYTFPLSSTVALNTSNDLWVVLHCTGINYPASYSSYSGDTNSSMVFMDNTWYTIQSLASDLNPTWMIKAVTSATPTTPQLTVSISGPTSVINGDVATFTAIGYDQATYSWTFQNGTPATAMGQSASTTWNAGGTYLVTVTATLGTQTVSASMTVNVADCPVNQLPFSFGAEASDPLECMSTHDADADGYGWVLLSNMISGDAISSYVHSGSDALASASYINNVGALTPDNWVVLPKVHIPTGGATITWWDKGLDANYANEYYSVMISSATGATTDFTTELWSGITTDSWRQCTASIENFDNQDVYIAFRHHNVSDMYWLLIDDISITSGFDLQVSINGPSVVAPYEPATFTAIGAAGATYTWTFEGAAPSTATGQTVTTSWNSEGSYMVTVTAMLNGDVVSDTITVTVAESQGDELSYGIEDYPLGNVGIDDEVTWGIRFEPAMLVDRDRLAYVSAYIAVAGSYELMVYQGGVDTPDSMLFQQSYTITDTNVWYDFDPGMDLDIDQSQSLWILLHTTDIAYPISVTQFTGDTNSCLIDLNGNGVFVAPVLSSGDDDYFYVSWMIKAFTVTDLQEPVIVDIQCLGDGEGIVLTPNSIENVCGQSLFYTQGQEVMLGFMPNMGSVLSHVYVGQVDMVDMLDTVDFEEAGEMMTAYILSFVADSTTLVEVFFNNPEANYMVTVNVNDPAMGYVEGSGSYSYGDVAELTAISYSGYNFEGWDDGDQSNPRLVTVTSDTTFTAIFADGQEGIDQAGGSSIIVTTQHSDIVVVGADAQSLFIFDAIGRRLFATDQARHEERYTVPAAGIYIVKASDGTVQRVVVL
ncbi:MAG: choice-of-anchor J domain-containing protein [Bacteroidales bacterium]|nr:choice-of-anchor J domain-containing protein [Bacteroidales bacterium]